MRFATVSYNFRTYILELQAVPFFVATSLSLEVIQETERIIISHGGAGKCHGVEGGCEGDSRQQIGRKSKRGELDAFSQAK